MKILHFSDTHLGYSELDKLTPEGINQREQDVYDAFAFVIDSALELKPDVILHSGDFFHRPSPPNRPMIFALEQLSRLSNAGIPIVIIAGNHSTPRTIYTSPILKAFQTIRGVYPVFNQAYETHQFGDLLVHGLPHINDEKILQEEMSRISPVVNKFNIIMLHTSIGQRFRMEEYGEQLFPPERLELLDQFDYVALGHWHNFQKVPKLQTAWYSGSTERMSDTEAGSEKGFCTFELEQGMPIIPQFYPIPARPWYRLDIQNCHQKSVLELESEILDFANSNQYEHALVSLYFHDLEALQAVNISNRLIGELLPGTLHAYIKRSFKSDGNSKQFAVAHSESMDQLLFDFITKSIDEKSQADRLVDKARHYFDLFERGEYRNR